MAATTGPDTARPFAHLAHGPDGRVEGCYVHGLFAGDAMLADAGR